MKEAVLIDLDVFDEATEEEIEAYNREVGSTLSAVTPHGMPVMKASEMTVGMPISAPVNVKKQLELVSNPERLFDFKTTTLTPAQQMFIMGYATKGTHLGGCELSGVPMSVVDKWMKDDEFASAMRSAITLVQDSLEQEFLRRAMNGSDKLLIEAMRAHKPEKYGLKTATDVNLNASVVHSWADLAVQASTTARTVEYVEAEIEEDDENGA